MVRRTRSARGYTLVEVVTAAALAMVLIPAVFPPIDQQVLALREQFEREAVRLILEGELELARDQGARGQLEHRSTAVPLASYGSAARIGGLRIRRVVSGDAGTRLSEVALSATWETKTRESAGLELKSWVVSQ